jgi:peptidoglycan/xylan/chitin deacetylase (PgdA/CDA1 family)
MTSAIIAERSPDTVKAIAAAGHEVLSHSYTMDVIPALLSDADEVKNIERCTKLLETTSGQKIVGWLSPRGTSKPSTPKLLAEHGYLWYGDVFDTDLPHVVSHGNKRIVAIPLSYDVNDMPSMKYGHPPRMMLDSFNEVIDIARARADETRIIDVTSHAHICGHHRGAWFYEKIIEQAMSSPDIWVGTRAQIADHILSMATA